MNLFLAVLVVVAAVVLTIMAIRFFFGARDPQPDWRFDEPAPARDAPVNAGDTLRNRPADNPTTLAILGRQTTVSTVLTVLVLLPMCLDAFHDSLVPAWLVNPWLQAILITPVMFYGGYPIHVDGWAAIRRGRPNMNSLASLGAIAAYCYGLVVCVGGAALPADMRHPYFEVTGVIVTLVLFARLAMNTWLPRQPAVPMQITVNRVSRIMVPAVILIALWTFVLWMVLGGSATRALLMAVSVLIIACPVALGWAAPLAAAAALENARRHGMQVRTIAALQVAQLTQTVVTAKASEAAVRAALPGMRVVGADLADAQAAVELLDSYEGVTMLVADGSENALVREAAGVAVVCGVAGDADVPHADVVTASAPATCVPQLIALSRETVRNIRSSLAWAFAFNIVGIPIAAGVLFPFTGWMLNPMIAGVAMIASCLAVFLNALRLRHARI